MTINSILKLILPLAEVPSEEGGVDVDPEEEEEEEAMEVELMDGAWICVLVTVNMNITYCH